MDALEAAEMRVDSDVNEEQTLGGTDETAGGSDFADALEGEELAVTGGLLLASRQQSSESPVMTEAGEIAEDVVTKEAIEFSGFLCQSCGAKIKQSIGVAGSMSATWHTNIMQQVDVRDRQLDGLEGLYQQYNQCVQSLNGLRRNSTTSCSSPGGGCSPLLGPRSPVFSASPQEDFELPRPAVDMQQTYVSHDSTRQLRDEMRMKRQELAALQQLLNEREEELQEKEQAHATLSHHATLLGRENTELRAQLNQMSEQLQRKTADVDRLLAEIKHFRDKEGGQALSVGNSFGSVSIVLPRLEQINRKIHSAELTCMAAASQADPLPTSVVAIGTTDGYVKLINGETARLHSHLSVSRELPRIAAVDLSPGTGLLLACSSDLAMRLLDLRAQRLLHTLRGHAAALSACGFLRGCSHAFSASADCTVKLWDLERGHTYRSIPSNSCITSGAVHNHTGLLVIGHVDGSIAICDARVNDSFSVLDSIPRGGKSVGLCMAPDGRSFASQTEDGVVSCVALGTLNLQLAPLEGLGPVLGPSLPVFSPDGAHLLAHGAESICCWSSATGERVLRHEVTEPASLCWDLPHAVSAHRNGHVTIWRESTKQ